MARGPRPAYPCAVYHVTARGNNRAAIFTDDRDRGGMWYGVRPLFDCLTGNLDML